MTSSYKTWGVDAHEHRLEFPCDRYRNSFSDAWLRGITIHAEPEIIFRWLCQLKTAPYSYDWIDNFGRKSPQKLTPGLDRLEIGQKIMTIFSLIDFETNKHLTFALDKRVAKILGNTIISYQIVRKKHQQCRLLAKILVNYPKGIAGVFLEHILPYGDLVMMRKQMINFKVLCEKVVT